LNIGQYTTGTAGTNYDYVVMEPGYPITVVVKTRKDGPYEYGIKCKFREVGFS